MEDRISFLRLTGLNPFADQGFFPVQRFGKGLWGKKHTKILPPLRSSEINYTGYPTVLVGKLPIATSAEQGRPRRQMKGTVDKLPETPLVP